MVRSLTVALVLPLVLPLALTACGEKFDEPIGLTPHGAAVRANMAAQIINPMPPQRRSSPSDGARAVLALDRYREGEVLDPTAQSTAPRTTAQ